MKLQIILKKLQPNRVYCLYAGYKIEGDTIQNIYESEGETKKCLRIDLVTLFL